MLAPMLTIIVGIYEDPAIVALGPTWSAGAPQASRSFGSAKSTSHQQARCTCNGSEATNDDAILNSRRCGRTAGRRAWLKSKNPASDAVRREREEEWR